MVQGKWDTFENGWKEERCQVYEADTRRMRRLVIEM